MKVQGTEKYWGFANVRHLLPRGILAGYTFWCIFQK